MPHIPQTLSYQLSAYVTKVLSWGQARKLLPLLSQTWTHWQNQMAPSPSIPLGTRAFVTCRKRPEHGTVQAAMTHFPQANANLRSPRVQLNGSVAAAVLAEGGQRARAKLQSISVNGGLLQLQQELSAGDFVEIAFHTRSGAIHGMAEMLHPTRKLQRACLQPFRFIALADDDHRKLRMALDSALDRSLLDPVSERLHTPPGF
jgi:hypothetical protein